MQKKQKKSAKKPLKEIFISLGIVALVLAIPLAIVVSQQDTNRNTFAMGPSGEALPIGDLNGWKQLFVDDFTKDAPTGSWATQNGDATVYTGDHGGQWTEYPDGWSATYTNGKAGYQPGQVLSVHDGVLDFYLHNVNGLPSGANPSPILGTSRYQTYGRYVARFKIDPGLSDYHNAWLLWPQSDSNWQCAESDFPEFTLNSPSVSAFAHYGCSGAQDAFSSTIDTTQWHTYTQEWMPGMRKYYIDGILIGTSTNQVFSQPERWQLQTEPSGSNNGTSGHLLLDWVAVYAYSPGTVASASPTPMSTTVPTTMPTTAPSSTAIPTQIPTTTPAPLINLLKNPSFENGLSSWNIKANSPAKASATTTTSNKVDGNYSAQMSITRGSSSNWNIQFYQSNFPVVAGKTYTVSFWAKASAKRSIENLIQDANGKWYGGKTINLTTTWNNYTYTFSSPSSNTTNFVFNLANSTATVWLDKMSVTSN